MAGTPPPPADARPDYVKNAALNTWVSLSSTALLDAMGGYANPGASGGTKAFICSYSGGCVDENRSRLLVKGGGHADYGGNEIAALALDQATPSWSILRNPTDAVTYGTGSHYADDRPRARHTYWNLQFINEIDRLVTFGGGSLYNSAGGTNTDAVDAFDMTSNDWVASGTYPVTPVIQESQPVAKDGSGNVYVQNMSGGANMHRWNRATNTWSDLGSKTVVNASAPMCVDTTRNRMLKLDGSLSRLYDLSSSAAESTPTFSGTGSAQAATSRSLIYVPDLDRFLLLPWSDYSTVWQIHPTTFEITAYSVAGTPPSVDSNDGVTKILGRFAHIPSLKIVVLMASATQDVRFFRYA